MISLTMNSPRPPIGRWLAGDEKYFLQAFKDSGGLIQQGLSGCSKGEMQQFLATMQPYIPRVQLRGMD